MKRRMLLRHIGTVSLVGAGIGSVNARSVDDLESREDDLLVKLQDGREVPFREFGGDVGTQTCYREYCRDCVTCVEGPCICEE